jgi:hypothetical protein
LAVIRLICDDELARSTPYSLNGGDIMGKTTTRGHPDPEMVNPGAAAIENPPTPIRQ